VPAAAGRARSALLERPFAAAVVAVLPLFVAARLLVLAALGLANVIAHHYRSHDPAVLARVREGLLGWDASYYRVIAAHGYNAAGHGSYRFFPLTPLVGHAVGLVPGVGAGAALLLIANLASLAAGALLYRLALNETGSAGIGLAAAGLLFLAPPAFVLVMGYSEPLFLVATLCMLIALRAGRGGWAALAGLLAGLDRPLGLLLVIPAVIEVARRWGSWRASPQKRLAGVLAAAAAPAGTAAYLAWCQSEGAGFWAPLRGSLSSGRGRGVADPFVTFARDASYLVRGVHVGTGIHLLTAIALVFLVVVAFRSLPVSYGAFATGVLLVVLSAPNLDSLERYALGCPVFVLAAATLLESRRVRHVAFATSAASLFGLATLAFLNMYVP
jgi:hypothetical protein